MSNYMIMCLSVREVLQCHTNKGFILLNKSKLEDFILIDSYKKKCTINIQ